MWLFTKIGFFSAVEVVGDPSHIQVRARVKDDIVALAEEVDRVCGERPKIIESTDSDYRFRIVITRPEWEKVGASLVADIDYSNFKSRVLRPGIDRLRALSYHEVWSVMAGLQAKSK
jgi:hypothetical protein